MQRKGKGAWTFLVFKTYFVSPIKGNNVLIIMIIPHCVCYCFPKRPTVQILPKIYQLHQGFVSFPHRTACSKLPTVCFLCPIPSHERTASTNERRRYICNVSSHWLRPFARDLSDGTDRQNEPRHRCDFSITTKPFLTTARATGYSRGRAFTQVLAVLSSSLSATHWFNRPEWNNQSHRRDWFVFCQADWTTQY